MTTNFERCRALHWGAAILNELLIEPSAPVDLVDLARELLPVLPDHAVIAALGQGAEIKLTSSQAGAVRDSRVLLEQLAAAGLAVTVDGRDVIEATLRDFPLAFVDDYLPYLADLPRNIHTALVRSHAVGSPNKGQNLRAARSLHEDLAAFACWWLEAN